MINSLPILFFISIMSETFLKAARSPILGNPARTGFVETKPASKGIPSFTETIERRLAHACQPTAEARRCVVGFGISKEKSNPPGMCVFVLH